MPINRSDPAARERLRAYQRQWAQRPDVKAKRKARESRPEVRRAISEKNREYRNDANNKDRIRLQQRLRKQTIRSTVTGWLAESAYLYHYRRRPNVKEKARQRALKVRHIDGGKLNRARVKQWRQGHGKKRVREYQWIKKFFGGKAPVSTYPQCMLELAKFIYRSRFNNDKGWKHGKGNTNFRANA